MHTRGRGRPGSLFALGLDLHLFRDPRLKLGPIDGRQFAQVGAQLLGVANIDVLDFGLWFVGVPMDEHADAARQ